MGKTDIEYKIDCDTIDNIHDYKPEYIKDTDTLYLVPSPIPESISIDFGGAFWVMTIPETGEIVGVHIDNYKRYFSKRYSPILRGKRVTDPVIKSLVIAIMKQGADSYTKKDFTRDLDAVISG